MKKIVLAVALIAFGSTAAFACPKGCCGKKAAHHHHATMHQK
jgi:hypothetical protein